MNPVTTNHELSPVETTLTARQTAGEVEVVMVRGMCALCKWRGGCKFRQPGTWVVQCDVFEEDPRAVSADSQLAPSVEARERSGRRPTRSGSYPRNR